LLGAPAADPSTEAKVIPKESLYEMFLKGGDVMWALLASSVLAVAIIIERFIALRRGAVAPTKFLPGSGPSTATASGTVMPR